MDTAFEIIINKKTFTGHQEGHNEIIHHFDLKLTKNEFVCLVGPSGCGKTTLLNIIAGLDEDYLGQVIAHKRKPLPNIGYVFQNPRLLPWRTVKENIQLVLQDRQDPGIIDDLLDAMNLKGQADVYPDKLSLGMSRRVAISRAFAVNPDLLLMDEPFVSLDPPTARKVRSLLLRLWEQRPHSVLFVTHDLREAIALADRLIFLCHPPMQIIADITVDIDRKQRNDEQNIESFRKRLLNDYPLIKSLL